MNTIISYTIEYNDQTEKDLTDFCYQNNITIEKFKGNGSKKLASLNENICHLVDIQHLQEKFNKEFIRLQKNEFHLDLTNKTDIFEQIKLIENYYNEFYQDVSICIKTLGNKIELYAIVDNIIVEIKSIYN